jgi:hypothetical protein
VPGEPAREENEEIENLVVTLEEALEMVKRGEIKDGKTIVALLSFDNARKDGTASQGSRSCKANKSNV